MKKQIQSKGKIVLYELCNDRVERCMGYELALLTDKGKVETSWAYEARELRWALEGYKTLLDAQARGVLSQGDKWKPYQGSVNASPVIKETPHNGVSRFQNAPQSFVEVLVDG
jgi:hypothetical protein